MAKTSLNDCLAYSLKDLEANLSALADTNLMLAFDSAVMISKNLRPKGERMSLVANFVCSQFPKIQDARYITAHHLNALSVVGDARSIDQASRDNAAGLFSQKIRELARLDEKTAKDIALNIKSFALEDNPVRSQAVAYLISASSFEELLDLARHTHHFSEEEQMQFLNRVEDFIETKPNAIKALIDGFINRVGYSLNAVIQKAEDIEARCKELASPQFAVMSANDDHVHYIGDDDNDSDVSVPMDATFH